LSGQHLFFAFKVANDVVQFMNNSLSQLQTKVNTRKQGHMKNITMYKSYAIENDLQNENKMK
jgi:hypothetical protein